MRAYEAELTETFAQVLIRLSAVWEGEEIFYGYPTDTMADLVGNRVFLAEENGALPGYLLGHTCEAKQKSSILRQEERYFEVEELFACRQSTNRA